MDPQTLTELHLKYIKDNYDAEKAKKQKQYLYSDLKHYGIDTWTHGKFYKQYKKEIAKWTKAQALNAVKDLWKNPVHEQRSLAISILNTHSDKLTPKDMPLIEKLMRESKGWAFLDSTIIPIMPVLLEKYPELYEYLKKWIRDDDFWVRRSAMLAQVLFFRKGKGGNKELFFEFARSQFDETWINEKYPTKGAAASPETKLLNKRAKFFIRKAIGWTLREMGNANPEAAYKFLKAHKDEMSGLSFRDGSKRLPEKWKKKLL